MYVFCYIWSPSYPCGCTALLLPSELVRFLADFFLVVPNCEFTRFNQYSQAYGVYAHTCWSRQRKLKGTVNQCGARRIS